MNIRKKFKDMWKKLSGGRKSGKPREAMTDSELSAEEVAEEEIFPEGKRPVRRDLNSHYRAQTGSEKISEKSRCCKSCGSGKKPMSKRTRPTNDNYQMIDPDDNTIDTGKS